MLLRTQYRCHPAIAAISNGLFYSGALVTAAGLEDRPPVIPQLLPATFLDTGYDGAMKADECRENKLKGGSFTNPGEATIIVRLVAGLLSQKIVEPSQLGVICL